MSKKDWNIEANIKPNLPLVMEHSEYTGALWIEHLYGHCDEFEFNVVYTVVLWLCLSTIYNPNHGITVNRQQIWKRTEKKVKILKRRVQKKDN